MTRAARATPSASPPEVPVLDGLIHSRIRLGAMALLAARDEVPFTALRNALRTTDGNLSSHMARLLEAGYVHAVDRVGGGRRPTVYRLTDEGRSAFRTYLDRMDTLLGGLDP